MPNAAQPQGLAVARPRRGEFGTVGASSRGCAARARWRFEGRRALASRRAWRSRSVLTQPKADRPRAVEVPHLGAAPVAAEKTNGSLDSTSRPRSYGGQLPQFLNALAHVDRGSVGEGAHAGTTGDCESLGCALLETVGVRSRTRRAECRKRRVARRHRHTASDLR